MGAEYCPFIVSLYDAYKHQGQLRLVMEYMNGGSLQVCRPVQGSDAAEAGRSRRSSHRPWPVVQDLVDKGGSSDEELIAKIAYNVLRGLHYLHSQGKIHRDVKPGNLLINSRNFVKIADCAFCCGLSGVAPGGLTAEMEDGWMDDWLKGSRGGLRPPDPQSRN